MHVYHCDPNWPICLFDFTFKNLCPKYVAFRVEKTLDILLIEDHFYNIDDIEAQQNLLKEKSQSQISADGKADGDDLQFKEQFEQDFDNLKRFKELEYYKEELQTSN